MEVWAVATWPRSTLVESSAMLSPEILPGLAPNRDSPIPLHTLHFNELHLHRVFSAHCFPPCWAVSSSGVYVELRGLREDDCPHWGLQGPAAEFALADPTFWC